MKGLCSERSCVLGRDCSAVYLDLDNGKVI